MTLTTSESPEVKGAPTVAAQRMKTIATVMGVLVAVVILSALSVRIQNPGKEGGQIGALAVQDTMTVALFAQVNGICRAGAAMPQPLNHTMVRSCLDEGNY